VNRAARLTGCRSLKHDINASAAGAKPVHAVKASRVPQCVSVRSAPRFASTEVGRGGKLPATRVPLAMISMAEEMEGYSVEGGDVDYDEDFSDVDVVVEVNATEEEVNEELCGRVVATAKRCIAEKGAFSLAIPGGSVAKALIGLRTAEGVEWDKVHLFFVNERCPEKKNYHLALDTFVTLVGIPIKQVYTVGEGEPVAEAALYEKRLLGLPEAVCGMSDTGTPIFDLILLGMGADGHVGSIYPYSKEALALEGLILGVEMPGKKSITFSLPLINAAKLVIIAAIGEKKAECVRKALEDVLEVGQIPGAMVEPVDGTVVWLLEEGSGSALEAWDDEEEEEGEEL